VGDKSPKNTKKVKKQQSNQKKSAATAKDPKKA
jgi:hypothetical protein